MRGLQVQLRGVLTRVALIVLAVSYVTCEDDSYYSDYFILQNETGDNFHGAGAYVPSSEPRRSSQFGAKPTRAWTVQIKDDPDASVRAPPMAARKSVLSRRFPATGPAALIATAPGHDGKSCPGGVCPNLDLYDDDFDFPDGEAYDFHYDSLYPYDNCHYFGGFNDFKLNGTEPCHLLVQGAGSHADLLSGGLDGLYLLAGCFGGKPLYIRSRYSGPAGEDRVLYYNPNFGSWELSVGREPSPDQLVMTGDPGLVSPIDVPHWHLAAVFNSLVAASLPSDDEELFYIAAGISIMCSDKLMETDDAAMLLQPPTAQEQAAAGGLDWGGGKRPAAGSRGVGNSGSGGRATGREGGGGGHGLGLGSKAAGRRRVVIDREEVAGAADDVVEEGIPDAPPPPPPRPPPQRSPSRSGTGARGGEGDDGGSGGGGGGGGVQPTRAQLEVEVREVREYWQRHEEEFYESQYPYGEYPPEGVYDDGYSGSGGYDDGYGYDMY